MGNYRKELEQRLGDLPQVTLELWKDTELLCILFRGKEIAHFQDHQEIDIRLSLKFIKEEGLTPLADSAHHQDRSKKSRWMLFRFSSSKDVSGIVMLVEKLLQKEYENTPWGVKS